MSRKPGIAYATQISADEPEGLRPLPDTEENAADGTARRHIYRVLSVHFCDGGSIRLTVRRRGALLIAVAGAVAASFDDAFGPLP